MEIRELKLKWWFRLLKVIYIIAFVFASIFFILLIFTQLNEANWPSPDYSYYKCDNGEEIFQENVPLTSKELYSGRKLPITDYNKLKELCGGDYELIKVYNPINWVIVILLTFGIIILIYLFFEIIKGIFFYVATGKWIVFKFRKKNETLNP